MVTQFSTILGVLAAVCIIAAALGTAWAIFRTSAMATNLGEAQRTISLQNDRIEILEAERLADRGLIADLQKELRDQAVRYTDLERVKTGETAILALAGTVQANHDIQMKWFQSHHDASMEEMSRQFDTTIKRMSEALEALDRRS